MKIDNSLKTGIDRLNNYEVIEGLKHSIIGNFSNRQLQNEFHARFKNRLYQSCLRLCHRNRLDDDIAKDFFQDTIIKALLNVNKFSFDEGLTTDHSTKIILKWLYRIAFNLFIDYLKKKTKFSTIEFYNDEIVDYSLINEIDEIEIYPHQNNLKAILQSAWDNLNDGEMLVIYSCIRYNCLNKKHMPESVINDISEILNIKPNSIRQIKLRALRKFRDAFNLP